MIKHCPECNRTYSDQSISFCLADGALLSAPYDAINEEPPSTAVLPIVDAKIPPTQAAHAAMPTIDSLPLDYGYRSFYEKRKSNKRPLWLLSAVVGIVLLIIIGFVVNALIRSNKGTSSTTSLSTPVPPDPASGVVASPTSPSYTNTPNVLHPPAASPEVSKIDPTLFPPDTRNINSSTTAKPETPSPTQTDYDGIFRSSEVTTRARVLSKPEPSYTAVARGNQVTGTVVLRAVFTSGGQVTNISVIRGLPDGLTEQAIAAAKQIRFTPATKDGRSVSMWMQLEYNFNLY